MSSGARSSPSLTLLLGTLALGPLLLLLVRSLAFGWLWPALLPQQWSTRAWTYVVSREAGVSQALGNSVVLGLIVGACAVLISLPAARVLARAEGFWRNVAFGIILLPVLAPPLASTLGLHRLFVAYGLVDTLAGVALSHLAPALPYAVLALVGSFARLDPDLEALGMTLGADRLTVWLRVIFPAVAPGLAVAFLFAFLISWSQYLTTLLIGGGLVLTFPLELVSFQRSGDEAIAAALCLIFVAPAVTVMLVVGRYLQPSR
jgi:putative spermidine/putrescine transport system permease protein